MTPPARVAPAEEGFIAEPSDDQTPPESVDGLEPWGRPNDQEWAVPAARPGWFRIFAIGHFNHGYRFSGYERRDGAWVCHHEGIESKVWLPTHRAWTAGLDADRLLTAKPRTTRRGTFRCRQTRRWNTPRAAMVAVERAYTAASDSPPGAPVPASDRSRSIPQDVAAQALTPPEAP